MTNESRASHTKKKQQECALCCTGEKPQWLEIGGMFLLILVLAYLWKNQQMFSVTTNVHTSVGIAKLLAILLIGLTASVSSCLAVVGGLLLSVSATWAQAHRNNTPWQKIQPFALFNGGRLIGYALFGGIVGSIGKSLSLSIHATGLLTLAIAILMISLGLSILKIIPKKYCTLPLPPLIQKHIARMKQSHNPLVPILLGALTFFVPCGYTQSMQLLALSSGSFQAGAMIMLLFAIGTLPALLGISLISSLPHKKGMKFFYTFAGSLVIVLGIQNAVNGASLAGIHFPNIFETSLQAEVEQSPGVTIDQNGQQIISMYVTSHGYSPSSFIVDPQKPTWVYAYAPEPVEGCATFLIAPELSTEINQPIKTGPNWIKLPTITHDFTLMCSMGMYRANVHVRKTT